MFVKYKDFSKLFPFRHHTQQRRHCQNTPRNHIIKGALGARTNQIVDGINDSYLIGPNGLTQRVGQDVT